jgi:hypothetical protein
MGTVSPTCPIVQPTPLDCVAAHLCIRGYEAPGYAIDRLAGGHRPEELVRAGLLEPEDRDEVERLLAAWDDACMAHDVEMAILEEGRPGPQDEAYMPSEEDEAFYDGWLASRGY